MPGAPPAPAPPTRAEVTVRALDSFAEYQACVALQTEIWGPGQGETVPVSLLRAAAHVGGIVAGAFTPAGELVGFVFGITGLRHGTVVHWSHALGVLEAARNAGIGRRLKEYQRAELARRGIGTMCWTFDPLVAKNAHLNLNRLGARVVEYVRDMYGTTSSPLHHGLATDRLLVEWPTSGEARRRESHAARAAATGRAPLLSRAPRIGDVSFSTDSAERPPVLWIEVPEDIQATAARDPAAAAAWQAATRRHFEWTLGHDYVVTALHRDTAHGRAFYVLERPSRD